MKKQFNPELPENFFDNEGYPTGEILIWIKNFDPEKTDWNDFIKVLENIWWGAGWGFVFKRKYKNKRTLELHTGGWSGNEDIIRALRSNIFFFPMTWQKTYVGGHFYFSIPCIE